MLVRVSVVIALVVAACIGRPDELSARAVAPILVEALDDGSPSLAEALREERRQTTPSDLVPGKAAKSK
jgi:hypothetical protein